MAIRVKDSSGFSNASGVGSLAVATRTSRGSTILGVLLKEKGNHEKLNDDQGESPCQ